MANKIQEQLGQAGRRVVFLLQRFAASLLTVMVPQLEKWEPQLNAPPEPTNKVLGQLRKVTGQALSALIPVMKQWQGSLASIAPAESPALLPDNVQQELNTAWQFVQTKLVPVVLQFLQKTVDILDPPLTQFYEWAQTKAESVPALAKLGQSPIKAKVVTAILPADRFLQERSPESLKPIVAKRAATYTLVGVLTLFVLLKPSHARTIAVTPSRSGVQLSTKAAPLPVGDAPSGKSVIPADRILVTDIQAQVANVSRMFGEGLINSVQANFRLGKLVVLVTDDWYQLSAYKQDQLMDSLLERSESLGFKKLLLADTRQTLLARNPDVGVKMVVLQRQPQ